MMDPDFRSELVDEVVRRVTGRSAPLFEPDIQDHWEALDRSVRGRRILVVGGAGSIGSHTLLQLLRWDPASLHICDLAENNLVELLRTIRSRSAVTATDLQILPVDFGSPVMQRYLGGQPPFDLVLNFAALKHVRSERDPVSLLQMLDTNLVKADRFLGWLRQHGHGRDGVFFVSSDKAANPASLMGASKRMMELMLFWHGLPQARGRTLADPLAAAGAPLPKVNTARFANVAFSDGSLPFGFLQRLAKGQPLSGPADVRRFFLSLEESGQLCALALLLAPAQAIAIPVLDPDSDLVTFKDIAEALLEAAGYRPLHCASEEQARAAMPGADGTWPCFFTESDTMGEKLFEEFVADGEQARGFGLRSLGLIPFDGACPPRLAESFATIQDWLEDPELPLTKPVMVDLIRSVVPTLQHLDSPQSLDRRM